MVVTLARGRIRIWMCRGLIPGNRVEQTRHLGAPSVGQCRRRWGSLLRLVCTSAMQHEVDSQLEFVAGC